MFGPPWFLGVQFAFMSSLFYKVKLCLSFETDFSDTVYRILYIYCHSIRPSELCEIQVRTQCRGVAILSSHSKTTTKNIMGILGWTPLLKRYLLGKSNFGPADKLLKRIKEMAQL